MRGLCLVLLLAGCAGTVSPSSPVPPPTDPPGPPILLGSTRWKSDDAVLALAATPDGSLLATGDAAGDVRLLDARDGTVLRSFEDHTRRVQALAFSPDGALLASVGKDARAVLRRVGDGSKVGEVQSPDGGFYDYASASFSPDGRTLAVGSLDPGVILVDTATGAEKGRWNLATWGVSSISYTRDGAKVVCGCGDGSVKLLDAATGKVLRSVQDERPATTRWSPLAFLNDDGGTLVAVRQDSLVLLWQASGDKWRHLHEGLKYAGAALSPDGKRIAVAARDGTLRWFDSYPGDEKGSVPVSRRALLAVAFVGGNDRVAVAGEDGAVRILDANTGAVLAGPEGHLGPLLSIAASPDGTSIGFDRAALRGGNAGK